MATNHEFCICPRSLNYYLLRTILLMLAGNLWTCGTPDQFIVVSLDGVPPSTKFIDLTASIGTLTATQTISGLHSIISFYLPTEGGPGAGNLIGEMLTVTVNARDDSCPLANSDWQTWQTTVNGQIQQNMEIMLHPVSACLTVMMNGSPQDPISGMDINYTITTANNGSSSVPASITTYIPENTSFVSLASPPEWNCAGLPVMGIAGPSNILCQIDSFAPKSQAAFNLVVQVNQTFVGDISNNAAVAIPGTSGKVAAQAPIITARNVARPTFGCSSHPGQAM